MRVIKGAVAFFGLFCAVTGSQQRPFEKREFFALHLDESTSPSQVSQVLGARHEGQIGELFGHHTFSLPKEKRTDLDTLLEDLRARRILRRRSGGGRTPVLDKRNNVLDGILWSQELASTQRLHKRRPPIGERAVTSENQYQNNRPDPAATKYRQQLISSLGISDPIFNEQWHLYNTVQPGHDLNVTGLWLEGVTGKGAVSAVVDDGLDMYSGDLRANYDAEGSYDFNEKKEEPKPLMSDDKHGTRCSGEIAAAKNDVCGLGVAYDSKIAGVRILSKPINDADEAAAVNYAYQHNDIYSCSWGPLDDGETMEAPGVLVKRAMVNGAQNGRGGKGSLFFFAAGNGGAYDDNCNFDGYTNSIYSITVGAIDRQGSRPRYSESCSAQMVVAYSSGSGDAIHTTDVGPSACSSLHGGTSAAGPLAAGVMALALNARPDLTWRDAQYLFLETAIPVHEDDGTWQTTKIGKKFSHDWGYGKVDAYTLVQKARTWKLVKPQAWYHSPWLRVHHKIPEGDQGLASSFDVSKGMMKGANIARLEHVTVTMNVNHTRRGDLSVELRSPTGVVSQLSTPRRNDNKAVGYVDWTFMSVAHWGESGVGKWTVVVKDVKVNEFNGSFIDWRLNLWGEAVDGSDQPLHPLPQEDDDAHSYEDVPVVTTSVEPGPTKTELPSLPTEHVDRPVNEKPSQAGVSATPSPVASDTVPTSTGSSESFLPSFFPTFGTSKRTQAWIYASFGLMIIFCIGLGIYFTVQRRKRLRNNPRDDYEFEMIQDEDDPQARNGPSGRTQRRGGELYNAFAEESDEEQELLNEGEEESYRDQPGRLSGADTSHGH